MKYILAYSLPIITFLGLKAGGYFSFSGVCYAFVIIPVIEQFTQVSSADNNYRWRQRFFDVLLYGNLFFVYGLLIYSVLVTSCGLNTVLMFCPRFASARTSSISPVTPSVASAHSVLDTS